MKEIVASPDVWIQRSHELFFCGLLVLLGVIFPGKIVIQNTEVWFQTPSRTPRLGYGCPINSHEVMDDFEFGDDVAS